MSFFYTCVFLFFFFKQKTAYEMRISDWSSDVCSSDLHARHYRRERRLLHRQDLLRDHPLILQRRAAAGGGERGAVEDGLRRVDGEFGQQNRQGGLAPGTGPLGGHGNRSGSRGRAVFGKAPIFVYRRRKLRRDLAR